MKLTTEIKTSMIGTSVKRHLEKSITLCPGLLLRRGNECGEAHVIFLNLDGINSKSA